MLPKQERRTFRKHFTTHFSQPDASDCIQTAKPITSQITCIPMSEGETSLGNVSMISNQSQNLREGTINEGSGEGDDDDKKRRFRGRLLS